MSHSFVEVGQDATGNGWEDLCDVCSSINIEALFERECEVFRNVELGSWD